MNEFTKYLTSGAILGLSIAIMVVLYLLKEPPPNKDVVELTPLVKTITAEEYTGKLSIKVSGLVVPHREIDVPAQVAGRVARKHVLCQEGNYVLASTPLLSIEKRDYDLEVTRLTAELQQSNNMIVELDSEIEGMKKTIEHAAEDTRLQQQDFERQQAIRSALSDSEFDQAKRALESSKRALTELNNNLNLLESRKTRLESGIELSQAQLDRANLDLTRTEIAAPMDGVIVTDQVEEGDFVQKGAIVVTFEDTSKAEVVCNLRLNQLQRLLQYRPGEIYEPADDIRQAYRLPRTPVTITSRSSEDSVSWKGELVRFDGIGVDEQTKTVRCRILVDDPIALIAGRPNALVRGMLVNVAIELTAGENSADPLLKIPAVAVQPGNYVWSVKNDRLDRHQVRIVDRRIEGEGESAEKMVVVSVVDNEFGPGAQVVVSPLSQPNTGIEVKIHEAQEEGAANSKMTRSGSTETDPSASTSKETAEAAAGDQPRMTAAPGDSRS